MADLAEKPEGEVVYLLLIFCEKQVHSSCLLEETSKKELSRICHFLEKTICGQIQEIKLGQFQEINLTQLWGLISCYSYMVDVQANPSLLMDLVDAIDRLLTNPGKARFLFKSSYSHDKLVKILAHNPKSKLNKLLNTLSSHRDFCDQKPLQDFLNTLGKP